MAWNQDTVLLAFKHFMQFRSSESIQDVSSGLSSSTQNSLMVLLCRNRFMFRGGCSRGIVALSSGPVRKKLLFPGWREMREDRVHAEQRKDVSVHMGQEAQ